MTIFLILFLVLTSALSQAQASHTHSTNEPTIDPGAILARSREVMGFGKTGGAIHTQWVGSNTHPHESDRTYPPFISTMSIGESWIDPRSGIERSSRQVMSPGTPLGTAITLLDDGIDTFVIRDDATPRAIAFDVGRNLDPWLVIADWSKAKDVRYKGRELFRDYQRIVLYRSTVAGDQRLWIDEKTGYPVKLDYEESHYLWGQRTIENIYSLWQQSGEFVTAHATFRMVEGEVEAQRTIGKLDSVDINGPLTMPEPPAQPIDRVPPFLKPVPPKVVEVSPTTNILSNPGYNEAVSFAGGEVFVFDATQGEERARQDHEIIRRLYPSAKKINVVVTDLAWPHVAGLRYWVANGATVISHRAAKPFLTKVLHRRWTLKPDSLERSRTKSEFAFIGINQATDFGKGAIRLFPIDGIGSEVALSAWIAQDRFLWASDYIQTLARPTAYASEVIAAVAREGLNPDKVAAEHLRLVEWSKVVNAQSTRATPPPDAKQ